MYLVISGALGGVGSLTSACGPNEQIAYPLTTLIFFELVAMSATWFLTSA